MELTEELNALGAALKILRKARVELMEGPDAVWNIVAHASRYLEERAADLAEGLQPAATPEAELIALETQVRAADAPYAAAS